MVKLITFDGQEHPFRVSYYALSMLTQETGKTLSSIKEDEFEAYEVLFYHALVAGHQITKKEFTLKREDIKFALDQCFFEFIEMIPSFFPTMKPGEKAKK